MVDNQGDEAMKKNKLTTALEEMPELQVFEASKLYNQIFNHEMNEAAYYKALERLTKEGCLAKISKGLYCRPKKTRYGMVLPSEQSIVSEYIKGNSGVVVGYSLYNALNLSTQIAKNINIYSNAISQRIKTVGNIQIERSSLEFNEEIRRAVEFLEVLSNFYAIQDLNYNSFIRYCSQYVKMYNESVIEIVLENMNYSKSTIAFLRNILSYYGISNSLSKYLSALSTYKYPEMEKIYELARV